MRLKESLVIVRPDCVEDISTVAIFKLSSFCQGLCIVKRPGRKKNVQETDSDAGFSSPLLERGIDLSSAGGSLLKPPFQLIQSAGLEPIQESWAALDSSCCWDTIERRSTAPAMENTTMRMVRTYPLYGGSCYPVPISLESSSVLAAVAGI